MTALASAPRTIPAPLHRCSVPCRLVPCCACTTTLSLCVPALVHTCFVITFVHNKKYIWQGVWCSLPAAVHPFRSNNFFFFFWSVQCTTPFRFAFGRCWHLWAWSGSVFDLCVCAHSPAVACPLMQTGRSLPLLIRVNWHGGVQFTRAVRFINVSTQEWSIP